MLVLCVLLRSPVRDSGWSCMQDFCFTHVANRYFTVFFGHFKIGYCQTGEAIFGELVLPHREKCHVFYVMRSALAIGMFREHRAAGSIPNLHDAEFNKNI